VLGTSRPLITFVLRTCGASEHIQRRSLIIARCPVDECLTISESAQEPNRDGDQGQAPP
jgi:hypothetical protein